MNSERKEALQRAISMLRDHVQYDDPDDGEISAEREALDLLVSMVDEASNKEQQPTAQELLDRLDGLLEQAEAMFMKLNPDHPNSNGWDDALAEIDNARDIIDKAHKAEAPNA